MSETALDLVARYNAAWFARDVAAMETFLGDDLMLWHNHLGRRFGKAEMLGFIAAALDVIARVEFRDPRCVATATGIVQQHEMHVGMKDGSVLTGIPQCIVYTVRDGKIRGIEEYVDGPALAAVKIRE